MSEEQTKIGRPLKYQTVDEMQVEIDSYFRKCKEERRPFTITGLAHALDISRQALLNYSERKDFVDTISRARRRIQLFAEESLYNREFFKGAQFSLKNNHGWKDKQEVTTDININVGLDAQLIEGRQRVRSVMRKLDQSELIEE